MGYFKDAVKGVAWMGALRGSTRVIAYIKIAILARLLGPEEFGIFGIATLVLALLEILTETGINAYLIQQGDNLKKYLNTAWVVSIFRGIIISFLIYTSSGFVSGFFNSLDAKSVLMLVSVVPLIRGFVNPSVVRFQKELEFNKEFYFRLFLFLTDAVVAVWLGFVLKSASAFIYAMLVSTIIEVIISLIFIKPKPKFLFDINKFREVIKRGKWITLSGILNYSYRQGDDIIVGRILDAYALGVYQAAYKISTLPIQEVGETFLKVAFPIFTKISGNRVRLRRAYIRAVITIVLLVFPIGFILFKYAENVVFILLGEEWEEAVPVVKVLSIYGALRSVSSVSFPLFLSIKKQEFNSYILVVATITMLVLIFPLIYKFGIVGAGAAALIGWIFAIPMIIFFTFKVLYRK